MFGYFIIGRSHSKQKQRAHVSLVATETGHRLDIPMLWIGGQLEVTDRHEGYRHKGLIREFESQVNYSNRQPARISCVVLMIRLFWNIRAIDIQGKDSIGASGGWQEMPARQALLHPCLIALSDGKPVAQLTVDTRGVGYLAGLSSTTEIVLRPRHSLRHSPRPRSRGSYDSLLAEGLTSVRWLHNGPKAQFDAAMGKDTSLV